LSRSESKSDKAGPIYRHGPESNRHIGFIGDLFTIKAREADTNGAYSLTEMLVSANAPGPPPHHHPDCEEAFYVIPGELAFEINGRPISAPAGTFVVVLRGAEHVYNNP
jgi:mannose-6-phosphate isomerase-like protein (cupin superfamily)